MMLWNTQNCLECCNFFRGRRGERRLALLQQVPTSWLLEGRAAARPYVVKVII